MEPDRPSASTPDAAIARVHGIAIAGDDARHFAQAQFAGDVQALAPRRWQWNAWLDASGRVQALMHLVDPGDGTLLAVLRGGDAARIQAALARYLLRARATLTARTFTGHAGAPVEMGVAEHARSGFTLGFGERGLRLDATATDIDPRASTAWRLADIRAGWPTLPADATRLLPPALGLERLGAIAFDKGCYPGQEIAARLHYRGGHKLRLVHIRGAAPLAVGAIGSPGGATAGYVLDAVASDGRTDALVVVPHATASIINILDVEYDVVSRFEP